MDRSEIQKLEILRAGTIEPDLESSTENYAQRFSGEVGAFILEKQADVVSGMIERLADVPTSVLEVGGGHAQLTRVILQFTDEVTVHGSDAICQERLAKLGLLNQVNFIVKPLNDLTPASGRYDLVVAIRLMAHVDDWKVFIKSLTELAGQAVIIDFASIASINLLSKIFYPFKLAIEKNTRPFYCQSFGQVKAAFEECGFAVTVAEKQFALPLALHRAVKNRKFSYWAEMICKYSGITSLFGSPVIVCAERK